MTFMAHGKKQRIQYPPNTTCVNNEHEILFFYEFNAQILAK